MSTKQNLHSSLLLLAALLLSSPGQLDARPRTKGAVTRRVTPAGMPSNYWLPVVQVKGKSYYRTFRVTSKAGFQRISDPKNSFRFFQGGGQYGEAFYLFRSKGDAKKFASCEKNRGAVTRNVIAEVLLPKDKFDQVSKSHVNKKLDWAMQLGRDNPAYGNMRDLRNSSHLLFGRWSPSPHASEPVYDRMNGAKQIGVVQRGMPSVLTEAVFRLIDRK